MWKNNVLHILSVGILNVMRLRMSMSLLPSVVCPAVQYFSTLPQNETILEKKFLNIECVLGFSTNSV
jgi:hypothetical protein